jgi:hypothetical protein
MITDISAYRCWPLRGVSRDAPRGAYQVVCRESYKHVAPAVLGNVERIGYFTLTLRSYNGRCLQLGEEGREL